MRLFFALWPPAETAHALGDWAREVAEQAGGKLTPIENIHLTLAFLGDADPAKPTSAARRVAARRHALPIDEFVLVRSRTSPKGSTYQPVERFPLSG